MGPERSEALFAWRLVSPTILVILGIGAFPLAFTFFESLHLHDLRVPGREFVGLANYVEALGDARFLGALAHTLVFTLVTVTLETGLGLALALGLSAALRGRGLLRTVTLIPWVLPTVIAALVWRFLFEGAASPASAVLTGLGIEAPVWFGDPLWAWVPLVGADVWKTTPFVVLLLLAGFGNVDEQLQDAARVDGADALARFWHVTLPALRPALVVAVLFRTLDALRVFDLIYVLTGGGPGTATETLSLYAQSTLLQNLRFGYGSALSMAVFGLSLVLALAALRLLMRETGGRRA